MTDRNDYKTVLLAVIAAAAFLAAAFVSVSPGPGPQPKPVQSSHLHN
jgi:hypothetical protein